MGSLARDGAGEHTPSSDRQGHGRTALAPCRCDPEGLSAFAVPLNTRLAAPRP